MQEHAGKQKPSKQQAPTGIKSPIAVPGAASQTKPANTYLQLALRKHSLQAKQVHSTEPAQPTAPVRVNEVLQSSGQPLDAATRAQMEARFGHDFSNVRIHSNAAAAQSALEVNAQAYTSGNDIVFGDGRYQPSSEAGQHLLTHEMVHVIQQGKAAPRRDGTHQLNVNQGPSLSVGCSQDGHIVQRKVIADVLSSSVGEFYLQELTPDELQEEAAVLAGALSSNTLSDTDRQALESNLQTLEDYALSQSVELAAATGYHLRQVIRALALDLRSLTHDLGEILEIEDIGEMIDEESVFASAFQPEALWDYKNLSWATDTLVEALNLVAVAEAGGEQSTEQFRECGARVTAVLYETQAVAIHLGYLHAGAVAASDFGNPFVNRKIADKVAMVREELEPMLLQLRSLEPSLVEGAVKQLQSGWHDFRTDFSSYVEELEDHAHTMHRIRQVATIVELAFLARGLRSPRPGAEPKISGGPGIGGVGAGGAAVVAGTVSSVEWLQAMERLVKIGALTAAAATGHIGSGNLPMPAKPTLTASAPVKPSSTSTPKATDVKAPESPALEKSPYHPDQVSQRVARNKPTYKPNEAHNPRSPRFNPTKTAEPADAEALWNSGKTVEAEPGLWFGKGKDGYYRFGGATEGNWQVHFNGVFSRGQIPKHALTALDKL